MTELIKVLDLQLFAEGGDVGGTQGNATENSGLVAPQEQNAEVAPSEVDLGKEFDELIKGKYKEAYGKKVEDAIGKRFKNAKDTQSQLDRMTPVLNMLTDKYGIKDINDVDGILKAMEEDNSYYEDEALEKGMSVEDLKAVKKVERENKELHRQLEEKRHQEETDRIYNEWLQQEEVVKRFYPSFDIRAEIASNQQFNDLITRGIDVKTAYEVTHHDEIMSGMLQHTAQTVEQKLVNSIANNGARPTENIAGSQAASTSKRDVSSLTKAERDELIKRAMHGERITLT
jgi:hypothetical protein